MMRMLLLGSLILSASLLPLAVPGAGAQITFGEATPGEKPLGLSISGGISLGSYQAGVNYGLLEVYRHAAWNPEFGRRFSVPRYRLRSVTGASAGNINTLLWAIEACTDLRPPSGSAYRSPAPDSSLFWKVWLSIGWDRLFDPDSEELALFDRAALTDSVAAPLLRTRMADPRLVEDCEVPAGITLTRITPDTLWLQNLPIETQRHVTAFTVAVDSEGAPLGTRVRFKQMESLSNEDQHVGILVRLDPYDGDIPLNEMMEAVKASASFPVAFAPVNLAVWYPRSGRRSEPHAFVDGGAFDNNPVGLARAIYALEGRPDTLDILYVNPYRHRSRLGRERAAAATETPNGGLASVLATAAGAVPTARQYELQLLARERTLRRREQVLDSILVSRAIFDRGPGYSATPHERLLLSSRAYPVLGEHLGSFGGFLAKPGREFDFYVGLYDALYMAAWHHTCNAFPDSTALGRQRRHRCVGQQLPALIAMPELVRDPAAQVLAWLYTQEFTPHAVPDTLPGRTSSDRLIVQAAFFDALGGQFAPADAENCRDKRLVAAMLCKDGLLQVLEVLRADSAARHVMSDWLAACDTACEVEREFVALLKDPMSGSTQMVDAIADRFARVERMMATRSSASGDSYLSAVVAARWMFEATYLRSRPAVEGLPSSVPTTSWARMVPLSYLGANLGAPGVEARIHPTINATSWGYLRASVIVHHNGANRESDHPLFLGGGLTGGVYFSNMLASEVGFGVNAYTSVDPVRLPIPELELHTTLLANQLRVSMRVLPNRAHHGQLHGRRGITFSAGLNDPVGLIYWISRL